MTGTWDAREWILAILRHDTDAVMPVEAEFSVALEAVREKGILSLLYATLCTDGWISRTPPELLAVFADAAKMTAARNLMVRNECRRISKALADAGVPAIWLKGVALAEWLYPQPHLRDADDADLLLHSHEEIGRVSVAIESLGYAFPNRHIAGDLVVHEMLAFSQHRHLELDLHWALSNKALYANRLQWQELQAHAIDLPGLGSHARGLSPLHAFMHAAIHRALNQLTGRGDRLRWLYDLHLLAARLSPADWQALQSLATERGLAGTCHAALEATASALQTQVPPAVMQALAETARQEPLQCDRLGSWAYMQWATLRVLPGWRMRARWLRQLLIPDMAHLRSRYGEDDAGAWRLLLRRLVDGLHRLRGYLRRRG